MNLMVIFNVFLISLTEIIISLPLFIIPRFRYSMWKVVLVYSLIVTVCTAAKSMFKLYSIEMLPITVVNNIAFFTFFFFVLERPKWKFWVAYIIFTFASVASEVILGFLPVASYVNSNIGSLKYTMLYLVLFSLAMFIYIVMFFIMRHMHYEFNAYVDMKVVLMIISFTAFESLFTIYLWSGNPDGVKQDIVIAVSYLLVLVLYVIMIVILGIKYTAAKKQENVNELIKAYEQERINIEKIRHENESVAKLRHDYINHITTVKMLMESDPDKAVQVLEQMEDVYKNFGEL